MRRVVLLLGLLAACDDDGPARDLAAMDLSVSAARDLSVACPGLDVGRQSGACSTPGTTCYPDNLTYCFCNAGQWACCGDARPQCPPSAPTPGGFCCPGAPAGVPPSLSCAYDGGAACVCGSGFAWQC